MGGGAEDAAGVCGADWGDAAGWDATDVCAAGVWVAGVDVAGAAGCGVGASARGDVLVWARRGATATTRESRKRELRGPKARLVRFKTFTPVILLNRG